MIPRRHLSNRAQRPVRRQVTAERIAAHAHRLAYSGEVDIQGQAWASGRSANGRLYSTVKQLPLPGPWQALRAAQDLLLQATDHPLSPGLPRGPASARTRNQPKPLAAPVGSKPSALPGAGYPSAVPAEPQGLHAPGPLVTDTAEQADVPIPVNSVTQINALLPPDYVLPPTPGRTGLQCGPGACRPNP